MENQTCVTNNLTPSRFKMSSSLKEKLKRLGRYHGLTRPQSSFKSQSLSVISTPTRSEDFHRLSDPNNALPDHSYVSVGSMTNTTCCNLDTPDTPSTPSHPSPCHTPNLNFPAASSVDESCNHQPVQPFDSWVDLQYQLKKLQSQVKEKEELLRKLKLVKLYRAKNNLLELQSLTKHWRMACQEALSYFQNKLQDPKPSLAHIIQSLQIDFDLVGYNLEEEAFDVESP